MRSHGGRERGWMAEVGEQRLGYVKGGQAQVSAILDRGTVGIEKARRIYRALGVDRATYLRERGIPFIPWPDTTAEPPPTGQPKTPAWDVPFAEVMSWIQLKPQLAETMQQHGHRWRLSTIGRAMRAKWQSDEDGVPLGGWAKALDSIENNTTTGDARAVSEGTAAQVGRRPVLPPK